VLFQPRIECWYYDKVFLGKSFPGAAALRNRASSIEESSTTCTTYVYKKIEARGKLIQVPYRSLDMFFVFLPEHAKGHGVFLAVGDGKLYHAVAEAFKQLLRCAVEDCGGLSRPLVGYLDIEQPNSV